MLAKIAWVDKMPDIIIFFFFWGGGGGGGGGGQGGQTAGHNITNTKADLKLHISRLLVAIIVGNFFLRKIS